MIRIALPLSVKLAYWSRVEWLGMATVLFCLSRNWRISPVELVG